MILQNERGTPPSKYNLFEFYKGRLEKGLLKLKSTCQCQIQPGLALLR